MTESLKIIPEKDLDLNNLEASLGLTHKEDAKHASEAEINLTIVDIKKKYEKEKVYFVKDIWQEKGTGPFYTTFNHNGVELDICLAPEGKGKLANEIYQAYKIYFDELNREK